MSLFEAGFNLPPGCSPGDPRAPWNQDCPPGVEDVLGSIVMWPEGPDEDTLVPEFGEVTDYEEQEPDCEADEEGHACWSGGGIRVEVTRMFADKKETDWVDIDDLIPVCEQFKSIIEAHEEAERFAARAQGQRNVAANRRAEAGRKAVEARKQVAA